MRGFEHFFRGVEEDYIFELFSPIHIILLAVWIIGTILIFKYKDKLKDTKLLKTLGYILITDQIILYCWQFGSGYFNIEQSLPLFHCRMAVWFLIYSIMTNDRRFKAVGMYWGIAGTLVGMILVDLYHFYFPHYTNFNFFLVHISLGFITAYYISQGYKFPKKDLITVLKFTNLYNIFTIIVNLLLVKKYPNVNYGYLMSLPPNFKNFPVKGVAFIFFAVVLINLLLIGEYLIYHFIENIFKGKKHEQKA